MSNEFEDKLNDLRLEIDEVDEQLYRCLLGRMYLSDRIGLLKKNHGVSEMSTERREEIFTKLKDWAIEDGMPVSMITRIYDIIFEMSVLEQVLIINEKD